MTSNVEIPRDPLDAPTAADAVPIESHPDIPVIGPLAGAFTWDVTADQWSWSEEMYVIHGFAPGDVVPTTELLLAHKHPDDRAKAEGVVHRFLSTGERFACYHRIVDAHSQERHVLVVAGGRTSPDGTVTEMSGFMIDLTTTRRNEMQPAIREALDGALANRGEIDMAKGAIMLGLGTDPEDAFTILRAASNRSNLKISDIAGRLVDELCQRSARRTGPGDVHELLNRVVQPDYAPPSAG